MKLTDTTLRFVCEHRHDEVRSLALQAQRYPDVDMPVALTQIAGRQAAVEKIPSWQAIDNILYPQHLSVEQCSSEITAQYKASVISESNTQVCESATARLSKAHHSLGTLTDLTGGFGIDCAFLAAHFRQAVYVERQEALCQIAAHNFPLLGLTHIEVCHADGVRYLQSMPPVDWIFIDPARRDGHGGKTIAIADCEPNVAELENLLLEKAHHVMVKLSPMLDLSLASQDLRHIQEAHIVSVNNECKELLLILGKTETLLPNQLPIHCVNLLSKAETPQEAEQHFTFTREQEQSVPCEYTPATGTYLYEPNASILKAGAFRSISYIYKVKKLHPNSHLYTSDTLATNFPGRRFRITAHCTFNKKELKQLLGTEKKANITVRNFPATVADLRKRLKLTDGGSTYLFATTLADEQKVLIRCKKLA